MRALNQRAGGIHHFHTAGCHFLLELGRNAVGADNQNPGFIGRFLRVVDGRNLLGGKHIRHLFVVDKRPDGINGLFAGGFQFQHFINSAFNTRAEPGTFGYNHVLFFFHIHIIENYAFARGRKRKNFL